jgi:site-specific recombinase XerD
VSQKSELLDSVRQTLRLRQYSCRTEQSYVGWIKRFILFHQKRHTQELGRAEVEAILNQLATRGNVSASTQNQALHALKFLYKEVLDQPLPRIDSMRAKKPKRLPVVLALAQVEELLKQLSGVPRLIVQPLYGGGLRVIECLRLRPSTIGELVRSYAVLVGSSDSAPPGVGMAACRGLVPGRWQ